MAANVTNLMKNIHLHIQEIKKTPCSLNSKRSTRRHIVMKLLKAEGKDRILKIAREKGCITYIGTPIVTADFLSKAIEARRQLHDIFKALKEKKKKEKKEEKTTTVNHKFSIWQGEIKTLPDKQELREFIISRSAL